MANVCCDDVVFYSKSNPKGVQKLWEDLETSVILCPDTAQAAISKLFQDQNIPLSGISLRGTVTYIARNDEGIFLDLETAWSPLYDAYQAIANHYGVSFILKSIEPSEELYYNTDSSGTFFPERYIITVQDDGLISPSGIPLYRKLEDSQVYESEKEILECLQSLGYAADSTTQMQSILDALEVTVHEFINPYDNVEVSD